MNPVLILTHNNISLTKRCVESIANQDIPVDLFIVDNGSTDDTTKWWEWLHDARWVKPLESNRGVSFGWNLGLRAAFEGFHYTQDNHRELVNHVLVIGNDTVLAPWTYRLLLSYELPFVTGVAVDDMAQIQTPMPDKYPTEDHPDFSCFLIRREVWEKVGRFNEKMIHYCSDCEYHIRAHRMGIPLKKACVPFYHERSSTLRLAPPDEQVAIVAQAERDRMEFSRMYHCLPGTPEYENLFK